MKITGRTDKPLTAIRLYKNERLPVIAVTVDLLTTGIDVPEICNLVFLRRVRSRILYEQMLGRATRLCPEVNKEVFRIFDAVDIYSALEAVSTMKPVVQTVSIPLAQLFDEITNEKSHQTPSGEERTHADDVRDQIVVRLRGLINRALKNLKDHPEQKEPLDLLEKIAGVSLANWPVALKKCDTAEIAALVRSNPAMLKLLERLQLGGNGGFGQVISTHEDQLISIETGYGKAQKPEDYLDSFRQFILDNRNKIAALNIAMTRPRELTREDLRQIRLALAEAEFNEATIRTAWREVKNEDIAASIIGYARDSNRCRACQTFDVCSVASLSALQSIEGMGDIKDILRKHQATRMALGMSVPPTTQEPKPVVSPPLPQPEEPSKIVASVGRGRPPTGKALSAKERQRASRAARGQQRFETFPPTQISMMLSAQASQALCMLAFNRDTSQKEVIEGLLIEAYAKHNLL